MFSFYGNGPQGKSFKIAKVFSTYTALLEDCQASEVRDGDFVVISYGEVGTEAYKGHLNTDTSSNYGNKNSTFWEKHYYLNDPKNSDIVFPTGKDSGWGYRFIAQMTGNGPDINIAIEQTTNIDLGKPNPQVIKTPHGNNSEIIDFTLKLFRNAKFWFGNYEPWLFDDDYYIIGGNEQFLNNASINDYYIYNKTGQIYILFSQDRNRDGSVDSWRSNILDCRLISNATIKKTAIDSFNENGELNQISVEKEDGEECADYILNFSIPNIPNSVAEITTLASNQQATIELEKQNSELKFKFGIPQGIQGPQGERGLQGDSLVFIGVENVISFDLVSDSTFAAYNPTTTNEVVVVTAGEESRWYFKLNGHWVYTVSSGSSLVWQEL